MNFITKIITFFKEVRLEMKKVNWPSREETIRFTLIVLGASAVVAAFLGSLDFIFSDLLSCFILKGQCNLLNIFQFIK